MMKINITLILTLLAGLAVAQVSNKQTVANLIKQGQELDAQDKIQLAIGQYSKAIQLDANSEDAYLARGNDFVTISRYPQALADFDKVISLSPKNSEAYNVRAIANYRLENYDKAIADYGKAIELGNFYANINRGVLFLNINKTEEAKADFRKAIILKPNAAGDAYFNLADALNKEQKYDEALTNIEKAVTLKPASILYQALYASVLLNLKRDNDGLAAADRILAIDSKNRDGFIYKSIALSNMKRFDEAIAVITNGINAYPDFHLVYQLRAFFYKQMGKTALAEIDEAKAKQLGSK